MSGISIKGRDLGSATSGAGDVFQAPIMLGGSSGGPPSYTLLIALGAVAVLALLIW